MANKFDPILGKYRQDDAPGSEITGTLTANYIPKATAAAVIGNSSIQDDGTDVTFGEDLIFSTGKGLKTNTSSGNTILFQAYDVDAAAYVTLATMQAGNVPFLKFNQDTYLGNGKALRTTDTDGNTFLLQAYDVDGAAYTTMATLTAANNPTMDFHASAVTIGSAYIYRAAGVDVSLADGGTGASLVDPGADRIMFWDDSATSTAYLAPAGEIVISTTSMYVPAASLYLYDNFI